MEIIRGKARRWVKRQGEDFHIVCSLAGMEADRVRAFAMAQIKKAIAEQHRQIVTENFLKGSEPGVGANLRMGRGTGPHQPRKKAKK